LSWERSGATTVEGAERLVKGERSDYRRGRGATTAGGAKSVILEGDTECSQRSGGRIMVTEIRSQVEPWIFSQPTLLSKSTKQEPGDDNVIVNQKRKSWGTGITQSRRPNYNWTNSQSKVGHLQAGLPIPC
jgi:hypothetical protein